MNKEESMLEALTRVRPELLNDETLKLFNEIMKVIDQRDDLQQKINKAKEYYLHELYKREQLGVPTKMPYESVEMFNILEGNK